MENENVYPKNEDVNKEETESGSEEQEETEFENPSTDPGFETSGDTDAEGDNNENDALNYKNDRENGAYNPKNI